ncbi:MAG TPA: hypothetical protein VIJ34_04470 [Acidimicrobiales bacterium]
MRQTYAVLTESIRGRAPNRRGLKLRRTLPSGLVIAMCLAGTVATSAPSSAVDKRAASVTVSGSGSRVSIPFRLRSGLAIFSASMSGRSTSTVYLQSQKSLIQPWGGLTLPAPLRTGSGLDIVKSGTYRLSVVTTGRWKVTVTQPRPSLDSDAPTAFSGTGPSVIGPVASLNVRVTMNLDEPGGQRITETGQTVSVANEHELIINSDSSWTSNCPTPPAGPYYLEIPEDFTWTAVVGSHAAPWGVSTGGPLGALDGSTFIGGNLCPIPLPAASSS